MSIDSVAIHDVLGALSGEHVADHRRVIVRPGCVRARPGRDGQVISVPVIAVVPELMDVAVVADIVDVLGALSWESVGAGQDGAELWQAGIARGDGQVIVPPGAVPIELMDVAVWAYIMNVLS